jgi:hypothetical protein
MAKSYFVILGVSLSATTQEYITTFELSDRIKMALGTIRNL